jgi:hypothetical protein
MFTDERVDLEITISVNVRIEIRLKTVIAVIERNT